MMENRRILKNQTQLLPQTLKTGTRPLSRHREFSIEGKVCSLPFLFTVKAIVSGSAAARVLKRWIRCFGSVMKR